LASERGWPQVRLLPHLDNIHTDDASHGSATWNLNQQVMP
jgi:hypothetical protein